MPIIDMELVKNLRRFAIVAGFLAAVIWFPPPAWSQVLNITISVTRDVDMGDCPNTPGVTYVVDPAENPGTAICIGAQSGRLEVTGDANARVTVALLGNTFTVSQGAATLSLRSDGDPLKGNIRLSGTGTLTVWIGAQLKIPPAGVSPTGVYAGTSQLTVLYK